MAFLLCEWSVSPLSFGTRFDFLAQGMRVGVARIVHIVVMYCCCLFIAVFVFRAYRSVTWKEARLFLLQIAFLEMLWKMWSCADWLDAGYGFFCLCVFLKLDDFWCLPHYMFFGGRYLNYVWKTHWPDLGWSGVVCSVAAMVKGLEFLSRRDGAWYDVDLSTTRIVEWQENLYLRVCLRWGREI